MPLGARVDLRARFAGRAVRPGGFAERARADAWVEVDGSLDDARATAVEPLACVLRGAERPPRGRILVVGQGFVGRLFAAVLRRRGDDVFALDSDPARTGRDPDGPVDAAVLAAPAGRDRARAPRAGRNAARLRRRRRGVLRRRSTGGS